jgi:DNA modification methylase
MFELHYDDCLDALPKLDVQVDFIFTDLPYGTTKCTWDTPIDLPSLWEQYWRLLKPNGCVAMFAQSPFDKYLAMSCMKYYRYEWIWEKTSATGHLNAKNMPMKAHENILIFYKSLPTYNPQKTSGHVRKTSKAEHKVNSKESDVYNKGQKLTTYDSTERYPRDVLRYKTDKQLKGSKIPTQKPVALCEYLIKTYSNPGELVLDSCMGSGSTGVAAIKSGRRFIGIENNLDHLMIASDRLEEQDGVLDLDVNIEGLLTELESTYA